MTHTIEVLQEDIDNAIKAYLKDGFYNVCKGCIITQALNRTFKSEVFETAYTTANSDKRKLLLSNEAIDVTHIHNRSWKYVKPFTFTATEY